MTILVSPETRLPPLREFTQCRQGKGTACCERTFQLDAAGAGWHAPAGNG
jgi:hypothetical protein